MACRIGITTDRERRKREWERQLGNLKNWTILETFSNKSDAQQYEKQEAERQNCVWSPGGDGDDYDTWYVYRFEF
ncbi:MAG: hypothetical protein OXC92_03560 [Flavobacteriaceae bacterium]|nr:hypothetical protein [Flavobacteriaceae bacterium]MCY4216047.1 hypothetical protein [Flavobacteriaceae bacterium]MCY4266845.1 hypothetical protein [Flavobacteriaceae bacterium]MCY4299617.1 hypothetical protein [Flavobacteriaceae bacterium]